MFNGFGCKGENKSPEIIVSDIPKNAKSLALTVYDLDAPTGGGWWHWLVVNIPVSKTKFKIGENFKKPMMQTLNSYGTKKFGGPCPPKGDEAHRYVIQVFALKVEKVPIKESSMPNLVGYHLHAQAIAKASATALYER